MKNVGIKKIQLHRVVKDFNLNVSISKKNGDLNEKWKIVNIKSFVFLILGNFQNRKVLKTWVEMFCCVLLEKLMVDRGCAYDPCGPKNRKKELK
jgi:hypothetical protein